MSTLALFEVPRVALVESTDHQNTPRQLALDLGWFDLDPCSNPLSNIQAHQTYSLEQGQDGLALPWSGSVFVNGPYSDPLPWCERLRAHREPWAALWKLDTTTAWFAQLMHACDAWAAFRDRLKFERDGNAGAANFSSLLVWGNGWQPSTAVLARLWTPTKGTF